MRDYIVNIVLFLSFILSLWVLWNANHKFERTHEEECSSYTRHGGEYRHCRWVKKGDGNK